MSESSFTIPCGIGESPSFALWAVGKVAKLWDGDGWKPESMSWKTGCYIHGGLSGPGQIRYTGPDATRFLEGIFVNNFSRFKVGACKHAIACNSDGLIVGHGVMQKRAENDFRIFVSGGWTMYQHSLTHLDVQQDVQNNYLFQVAGPKSKAAIEDACGEDIGDVEFLRFKDITIAGYRCELMRIGMAGTLAYELHGPIAEGPKVYDALLAAGQAHEIKQLGWKTYYVNHIEAGFPQQIWTFLPAVYGNREYLEFIKTAPTYRVGPPTPHICGSVDPADMRARYRTPHELSWERSVVLDHDFIGRAAIEAEKLAPKRTIVTLEWSEEDVMDVLASHFRDGEEYKMIEFPVTPQVMASIGHADHVLLDGKPVGISSGTAYSYYFRKILSHCTVDIDQATIGNELILQWGDHGGRIKDIRVKVAPYPYLTEDRNQTVAANR